MTRESLVFSRKSSGVRKRKGCVFVLKLITSKGFQFSTNGLIKRILDQSGDDLLEKYCKVHDDAAENLSKSRGFRAEDYIVATFEQIKRE